MSSAPRPTRAEFRERLASVSPRSWVVPILIVLTLVLVLLESAGYFTEHRATQEVGCYGPALVEGEWWRTLASSFIHQDFGHYAANMFTLFVIGRLTERLFGSLVFLGLLVLSTIVASYASVLVNPLSRSIGSSDMVYAAIGALLAFIFVRRAEFPTFTWWRLLILSALLVVGGALALGTVEKVNDTAHVAGFFAGLLLGGLLTRRLQAGPGIDRRARLMRAGLVLIAASPLVWWGVRSSAGYRCYEHTVCAGEALTDDDLDRAQREYSAAIELYPTPVLFRARGRVRRDLGLHEEARADYDRAIELDPNSAEAYEERACLRRELGDAEGAEADSARARQCESE